MQKWVSYNANPDGDRVGDCVIRALSAALGISWDSGAEVPLYYWERGDSA